MDLKLTEHVRNMLETFPSFISKKPNEIPIFGGFLSKKLNFGLCFAEINIFSSLMFITSL